MTTAVETLVKRDLFCCWNVNITWSCISSHVTNVNLFSSLFSTNYCRKHLALCLVNALLCSLASCSHCLSFYFVRWAFRALCCLLLLETKLMRMRIVDQISKGVGCITKTINGKMLKYLGEIQRIGFILSLCTYSFGPLLIYKFKCSCKSAFLIRLGSI